MFIYMWVCVCTGHCESVEDRGQRVGVGSLPPPCESWRMSSSHQAWQQAFLMAEALHWALWPVNRDERHILTKSQTPVTLSHLCSMMCTFSVLVSVTKSFGDGLMEPRLPLNLLCGLGWPWTSNSPVFHACTTLVVYWAKRTVSAPQSILLFTYKIYSNSCLFWNGCLEFKWGITS